MALFGNLSFHYEAENPVLGLLIWILSLCIVWAWHLKLNRSSYAPDPDPVCSFLQDFDFSEPSGKRIHRTSPLPLLRAVWAPEQSPVCPFECQTSEIFPQLLITPLLQDAIVTHLSPQKLTLHPSSTLCLDAKDTWRVSGFFSWNFKRCKATCFKPLPILMTSLFRCVLSVGTAACHTASHQIFRVTQKPLSYSISVNSHQHRKGHRPQLFTFEFVESSHFFGVASQWWRKSWNPCCLIGSVLKMAIPGLERWLSR